MTTPRENHVRIRVTTKRKGWWIFNVEIEQTLYLEQYRNGEWVQVDVLEEDDK